MADHSNQTQIHTCHEFLFGIVRLVSGPNGRRRRRTCLIFVGAQQQRTPLAFTASVANLIRRFIFPKLRNTECIMHWPSDMTDCRCNPQRFLISDAILSRAFANAMPRCR
jgi:hypothetical protein